MLFELSISFARLPGKYDAESLTPFFQDILGGNESKLQRLPEPPKITARICGFYHKERDPEVLKGLSPPPPEEEELEDWQSSNSDSARPIERRDEL